MSVDVEAGGALATAGLAAKTIDPSGGAAHNSSSPCANCRTPLVGAYCHACGQVAHVHRSLWHMIEEGMHGLLHFDSKSWRTLPMLIARPGLLTRRYIDGQRVRYVSPLALFLFLVFSMFFIVSSLSDTQLPAANPQEVKTARLQLQEQIRASKQSVAEMERSLASATDPAARQEAQRALDAAKLEQQQAEAVLSVFENAAAGSQQQRPRRVMSGEELSALTQLNFGEGQDTVNSVLERISENPELMQYKFKNTAYKFSFMLIPISLPFLWLMFFWRRGITTYDHIVFVLYSLSFMSLLIILIAGLSEWSWTKPISNALWFVPPLHIFMQLKEAYGLSFFSTLWRTFALLISAGAVFLLFIVLVAALTAY